MDIKALAEKSSLRKYCLWTMVVLAVFAVAGFLVVPPVLKSVLTRQLKEKLHREVSIREIQFNPFVLAVKIGGFSMKERDGSGPFVSFDDLYLNFQLASVYRGGPVLRDIILKSPRLTVVRGEDLKYNFSDLLEEFASKPGSPSKPIRYSLNNIEIVGGSVDFEDRPNRTHHTVRDLRVAIPFLSNLPYYVNVYVQPVFLAKINGTPVALHGKTKPFSGSRETSFDVNIDNFNVPYYLNYVPLNLKFRIASGLIDTRALLSFNEYKDKPPVIAFTGKVALKSLAITDLTGGPVFSLPLLDVSIASSDVFGKKASLASVLVQSPELRLLRDKGGTLNVMSMLPGGKTDNAAIMEDRKEKEPPGAPPSVDAAEIRLAGGKVVFSDLAVEKPFRTTLDGIDVTVRHFGNAPGKSTAVEAAFRTEAGEGFSHVGDLTVEPFGAEGTVEIKRVLPKKYSPYYAGKVLFDVEDGVLDLSTRYRYAKKEGDGEAMLSGLSATLRSLRLRKRGAEEDFLRVPLAAVKDTDIHFGNRTLTVGEFSTQKGSVSVRREADGAVNLGGMVPPGKPAEKADAPETKGAPPPAWVVMLKTIMVDRYAVRLDDASLSRPVSLVAEPVTFTARDISTKKNSRGRASLRIRTGEEGVLAAAGPIGLNPVSANLKVEIKGLDIVPLQPYFTEKMKIVVTRGDVSASGDLALGIAQDNTLTASYKGDATLARLATLDKANSEDFLKWDSLHLGGIDSGINPLRVEIAEIALTDFYSRLAVNPDGTLNVQGIVESEAKTTAPVSPAATDNAAPPRKPEPAKLVRIGKVTLQGGSVNFTDRYIRPSYFANLTEVGGRVSGLSSEEDKLADVDLRGRLDNGAPLEITGKVNPLRGDLYVDLKVDFKDIDLSPLTPYSGRYAGYTIQKGKLTLGLKYLIVKKKLDATNTVFLDQFTFGDRVESPEATKLPVRLAIALLKDRKGEIRLDLPLSGSLDDPKFSLGSLILKVIVNILIKAATSPFALLGAIFGGGEELSYLEFEYGRSDLDDAGKGKLRILEKALYDRPALKLEIAGRVDAAKDKEKLRQSAFERKVKARKLGDLVKKGVPAVSLDNVVVAPAEYPKYLALAYRKETFPKPRNIIGIAKDLPVPEMEKLMLAHIQVTEDDLRHLARQRAQAVKDDLLKPSRVEPGRIFLVEPKSLSPEKKEKTRDSRVDFVIK